MSRPSSQRDFALQIVERLHQAGYEAMWAGGCVRDQLLGLVPKDYDIATNARPAEIQALFGKRKTLAIGAAFGVIGILAGRGREPVEVATFRSDGAYLDGRHPQSVVFTTAEQDAQRRDFTINGLFYDPLADEVIDYVNGQADLAAGIIRAIGNPRDRFAEDKLRMLRAVRFATTFNFEIEVETLAAIRQMAAEVTVVSAERIGAELERILIHPRRSVGVQLLEQSGLLRPLLPELTSYGEDNPHAWHEILDVLDRLDTENLSTALAALLHKVCNPHQVAACARRFRWTNKQIELSVWLVRTLEMVSEAVSLPWPQLQRVLVHEGANELIRLGTAVFGAKDAGVQHCIAKLALPESQLNPPPLLNGDDLVSHGLEPGPHFASLLTAVRDAQLESRITNVDQAWALIQKLKP
ncbi:CCA tRNA nucleotidyltransferase [Bythopirellula polymerisocia]|uniref:tRNA nucleotidyltransferase/poly(A) polymerase n=1 Tax=Bythopirellula polymerisocia TaxID=2528003 RepID=A0A5C6CNH1_9BACT|nr:CCA tRNA nucleotidyltransferase [Bythopirellula polymerisocia]TWU25992.1 tRNA nucleotidyltransferase/poly(A) polymerase [Bythopirellula polymerisocia]